jgi:hypothetical protein
MKNFLFIAAFLCSALSMSAQAPVPKSVGDTLGPWTIINFEESSPYIQNSPSLQNIWQIGTPQKAIFNQSFSAPNAIVTDLQSFYPVNNHSTFDLFVGEFNSNWAYPHCLFIDFRHKIDSDTLRDGGYITVSWDHGLSWLNILEDTIASQYFFATPSKGWGMWGNTNLYTSTDTLFNGELGFSGRSGGWVHSCMAWYDLPVKGPSDFPPDTMLLRFNFISDNINNSREGWMIDDIRIFSIDLGSGVTESMTGTPQVRATPNPVSASATVRLGHKYDRVEYLLIDPTGRTVSSGKPGTCSEFEIRRTTLSHGIYMLKITDGAVLISVCRVVFI